MNPVCENKYTKIIHQSYNDRFWNGKRFVFLNFNIQFLNEAKRLIESITAYNDEISIICFIDVYNEEVISLLMKHDCGMCIAAIDFLLPDNVVKFYPKISVFRIIAPYCINKSIKNVLYLDSDIICAGSFAKIYNNYRNNIISMALDISYNTGKVSLFDLGEKTYTNAGVILFNTEKYKSIYSLEYIFGEMVKLLPNLNALDQDFLNLMFKDYIQYLPFCMNYQANLMIGGEHHDKYYQNTIIFYHFTGPKPWKYESNIRVTKVYYLNLMNDKKGYFIARLNIFKKTIKSLLKKFLVTLHLKKQ